jgi:TonB family protein
MWDWEGSSVPYRPIQRRRLIRRRLLTAFLVAFATLSFLAYSHHRSAQPVGERVFNQVVSTVSLRYFDASYHGVPWKAVVERYRPQVINAPTVTARYRALRAMIAQLHDSHTAVYSPDELRPLGELKLPHDARARTRVLQAPAPGPDVDWKTIAPGVGYLRIASFPDAIGGVLGWALADVARDRALVLDLRGNPGGLIDSVDEVAGAFLPEGTLISSGTRRYHFFGPQRFTAHDGAGIRYSGRVVVLVDKDSRSGAESLARALQYYRRALLVGTHTPGKVLGVDVEIALDDGGLLRVATLDMRAPDGQRLEGRGVTPDFLVANPSEQMSTALRLVAEQTPQQNPSPVPSEKSLGVVKACPLSIRNFSISGAGSTHRLLEYRIGVRATGRAPMVADFVVSGDDETAHQIEAVGVDAGTDAIVFDWPSLALKHVGVAAVELDGKRSECDPSDITDLTKRAPLISDSGAAREPGEEDMSASLLAELAPMDDAASGYVPVFDDSVLVPSALGRVLRDARVLKHVMPYYPDIAREIGEQGDALLAVVVGPGGAVLRADVVRSDAGPLLNGAALNAARRTPYSEPLLAGAPSARTYLLVMSFRPGGLTGLQFASRLMNEFAFAPDRRY